MKVFRHRLLTYAKHASRRGPRRGRASDARRSGAGLRPVSRAQQGEGGAGGSAGGHAGLRAVRQGPRQGVLRVRLERDQIHQGAHRNHYFNGIAKCARLLWIAPWYSSSLILPCSATCKTCCTSADAQLDVLL